MKYFIVRDSEGLQGNYGVFNTATEATEAATGTKTVIRNGQEFEESNFSFPVLMLSSDKDPKRVLFQKQPNGTWLDIEPPKTIQDFQKEYKVRADRGLQIINQVREARLLEVNAGDVTLQAASEIDKETKLIQFTLREGDLQTAKLMLEDLPDSTHKTEFLTLVNTAIAELYE